MFLSLSPRALALMGKTVATTWDAFIAIHKRCDHNGDRFLCDRFLVGFVVFGKYSLGFWILQNRLRYIDSNYLTIQKLGFFSFYAKAFVSRLSKNSK